MNNILSILALTFFVSCNSQTKKVKETPKTETKKEMSNTIVKTDEEWKKILTPEQFYILREKGTERAYTGEYDDFYQVGSYHCAACDNPLFKSDTKFKSHCGWPSFDQALPEAVIFHKDTTFGMVRTEVMCAKCGGHLGHVFDDGPKETTGQRFCTNSVSIKFFPKTE